MTDETTEQENIGIPQTGYTTYLRYDSGGRVLCQCTVEPITYAALLAAGWQLIESGADPSSSYIKDGAVTPRPESPATLDGMTLKTLPAPCQIQIDAALYDCTEDHADLSFDAPGTYAVRVIAWPYLDKELTVENPA